MSNRQQQTNKLKDRLRQKLENKNSNNSNLSFGNSNNFKRGFKKICLTMIVKNEAKNMVRLLNSLTDIIDMISIVDTGSTDETETIIYDWGKEHNIPTKVHNEPFKNFAYNRTHSIRKAKETYKEADYFLLSDADFIWEKDIGVKFDKVLLVDHKYLIEQYNKAIRYWNIRLLSAKVDWECVGVTHEYWQECKKQSNIKEQIRCSKISTLAINDQEDGGCKTNKFERDEKLLKEGLLDKDTPNDLKTRYKFYLAQTLKDVGRFDEAIEWYQKRIDDGGWPEEVYHSKYQLALCNEQLGWHKKRTAQLLSNDNNDNINNNDNDDNDDNNDNDDKTDDKNDDKNNDNDDKNNDKNNDNKTDNDNDNDDDKNNNDNDDNNNNNNNNNDNDDNNDDNDDDKVKKDYIKKWNYKRLSVSELLQEASENFTIAAKSYLDAYNYRPIRAEALYNMTKMYRILGLNDMAFKYAVIGNKIQYPKDDTLFIEKACYDFLFDLELSIVSFYIKGQRDIGREATSRLLTNENLPEHLYKIVEANSRHYI